MTPHLPTRPFILSCQEKTQPPLPSKHSRHPRRDRQTPLRNRQDAPLTRRQRRPRRRRRRRLRLPVGALLDDGGGRRRGRRSTAYLRGSGRSGRGGAVGEDGGDGGGRDGRGGVVCHRGDGTAACAAAGGGAGHACGGRGDHA